MTTVTIRVPADTHERLRRLAEERGRSIGEVVDDAVRRMEEEAFWAEVNASYERLWADPATAAELEAETAMFDTASLMDFDEPPYEGIEELLADSEKPETEKA